MLFERVFNTRPRCYKINNRVVSHRVAEPVFKSLPSLHVCQKFLRPSQILGATQQSDALLPRIFHAEFPAHYKKTLTVCKGQLIARLHIHWSLPAGSIAAVLFLHVQSVTLLDWTRFVRIRFSKNISENRIGSEICLHQCNHDRPQVAGEKSGMEIDPSPCCGLGGLTAEY